MHVGNLPKQSAVSVQDEKSLRASKQSDPYYLPTCRNWISTATEVHSENDNGYTATTEAFEFAMYKSQYIVRIRCESYAQCTSKVVEVRGNVGGLFVSDFICKGSTFILLHILQDTLGN